MAKNKMAYFVEKKRKFNKSCFYWNGKKEMLKYGIPVNLALGKDYIVAICKWKKLYTEYLKRKQEFNKYGFYIENNEDILNNENSLNHIKELYFNDRRFKRLAETTRKSYLLFCNRLTNDFLFEGQKKSFGNLQITDINRAFVKSLYEKLLKKGAVRSASLMINALSQLIITAQDYGLYTDENPCKKLVIEKNEPRNQIWKDDEVIKFCDKCDEKGYFGLKLAVLIAYYTAQRESDIEKLKWNDFDFDLNIWKLKQSKTKNYIEIPIYKIEQLQKALRETQRINEFVCNSIDGKPYYKRELIPEQTKKIIKLSNIRNDLMFRDLRRTAILKLDEAGCTLSEIASISGHSRKSIIDIIEVYAPKTILKAEKAFDKVFNV